MPWAAFGVAFTVFPAAVIGVSEGLLKEKPPSEKKGKKEFDRSADEIFTTGLENLQADATGWLFGKPSALYSNAPKMEEAVAPKVEEMPYKEEMRGTSSGMG